MNGQEEAVGSASVQMGRLVTAFSAYQPRTFALRLGSAPAKVAGVNSVAVDLPYTAAVASNDGEKTDVGFDDQGDALPAEMLPSEITFNDVHFRLAPAKTGNPDAVVPKGQRIKLPAGGFNRVYILAAAAHGDQTAKFDVGMKSVELNIEDWNGFIGQWDDRQWSSIDSEHDKYSEMTGLKPGYTKRADLAWYCSHHHNAAGENLAYSYAYLFAYGLDLPPGTREMKLPDNRNIRILAMSVVQENPGVTPVQPLYDVLAPATSQTR